MLSSIKSEYIKLLTIRSTYVIFGLMVAFMGLFAFYAHGVKEVAGTGSDVLSVAITIGLSVIATFSGVIGLLLVTQEYRYNTILYTLTASNNRAKSLLAKIFVLTTVSIFLTFFFGALTVALIRLGVHFAPLPLAPQTIYYKDIIWQCLLSSWAIMMYATLISAYIRHQVGSVVAYFLIPTTIEGILVALLKNNANYLPFKVASAISNPVDAITPTRAAVVTLAYVVVGLIIALITFTKRDAN